MQTFLLIFFIATFGAASCKARKTGSEVSVRASGYNSNENTIAASKPYGFTPKEASQWRAKIENYISSTTMAQLRKNGVQTSDRIMMYFAQNEKLTGALIGKIDWLSQWVDRYLFNAESLNKSKVVDPSSCQDFCRWGKRRDYFWFLLPLDPGKWYSFNDERNMITGLKVELTSENYINNATAKESFVPLEKYLGAMVAVLEMRLKQISLNKDPVSQKEANIIRLLIVRAEEVQTWILGSE